MIHTQEPWYVAHHQFIYADGHLLIGQTACPNALSDNPVATQAINAERIVACVNACAGISTETLVEYGDGNLEALYKMQQQRDELLAMIQDFLDSTGGQYNAFGQRAQLIHRFKAIAGAQGDKT
jgi:hypothetical protein